MLSQKEKRRDVKNADLHIFIMLPSLYVNKNKNSFFLFFSKRKEHTYVPCDALHRPL